MYPLCLAVLQLKELVLDSFADEEFPRYSLLASGV